MNRRDTDSFGGQRSYSTGDRFSSVNLSQGISRCSFLFLIFQVALGHAESQSENSEQLVYRGNRDCYCFLVFALLVIFLTVANQAMRWIRDISPPFLVRQTAFVMRSALNGSHGEATNSDDVVDHLAVCEMVDSELEVAMNHCGLEVSVGRILVRDDELMNFALLCGAVTDVLNQPATVQGLLDSLFLVKLCVAEELCSTLSYTELLYDLFIYRNCALKVCRAQVGETFFHFMKYDIEQLVEALGDSPRESQLRSSHGEMTEGDDLACPGKIDNALAQLKDCTSSKSGSGSPKGQIRSAKDRIELNKRLGLQARSTAAGNPMDAEQNRSGQPVVNMMVDRPPHAATPEARQNIVVSEVKEKKEKHSMRRVVVKQIPWSEYPNGANLIALFAARKSRPFYFNGETYSSIPGEFATIKNYQSVCKEVGYGFVKVVQVTDSKGRWVDCKTENRSQPICPLVTVVDVEGYKRHHLDENGNVDMTRIVVCPRARHVVLLPLFRRMQKLPNSDLDTLHNKATECSVDRVSDLEIPTWLIASTVAHRKCQLDLAYVLHHNKAARSKLTKYGGAVGIGEDAGMDHLLTNCSIQTYQFMHLEHRRNPSAPTYPVRDDFTVLEGHEYLDEEKRVVFKAGCGQLKEQYSTWVCGFNGLNQPPGFFHANDAGGVNHGLKRVLGAKESLENELLYRGAAKSLGKNIMQVARIPSIHIQPEVSFDFASRVVTEQYRDDARGWGGDDRDRLEKAWQAMTRNDPRMKPSHPDAYSGPRDRDCSMFIAAKAHKLASSCSRYKVREVIDRLASGTKWLYYTIMRNFLDVWHSAFTRQEIANLPHLKMKLRQAYCRGIRLHDPENVLLDRMKAAVKNELSKFGKAPRLYQQMGRGCMYAPELVEFAKVLIDGIHVECHEGVTMVVMVFGKRKDGDLEKLFNDMADAMCCENLVVAGVYSDDMVIAGCVQTASGREVFAKNVDVSSNDSSQDLPSFLTTFMILNQVNRDRALGLVEQCMKPIEIVNPENRDEKVKVQFNGPFEGSGSTLTTLLNHVGSYLILMGTLFWMGQLVCGRPPCGPELTVEECIRRGAAEVGHMVTVEDCAEGGEIIFEKVTFLHMHPARVVERPEVCCSRRREGGVWIPRIDIGCLMRKWGRVDGSMTHIKLGMGNSPASIAVFGAMSPQQQMDAYCGGVVRGWKNEAECPILAALRHRFTTETSNDVVVVEGSKDSSRYQVRDDINYRDVTICPDTLRKRYDLSNAEIEAIVCGIKSMHVGSFVVTSGVAKIMKVCYGVQEIPDSELHPGRIAPDDEIQPWEPVPFADSDYQAKNLREEGNGIGSEGDGLSVASESEAQEDNRIVPGLDVF